MARAVDLPVCARWEDAIAEVLPQIAWRAGLDLNPIDVNNPAEAAWLETLVWPEQTARLALSAAMAIAATASRARAMPRTSGAMARIWRGSNRISTVVLSNPCLSLGGIRSRVPSFTTRAANSYHPR
jgi:hypothetical protein